jgi:hypothetical protein
VILHMVLFAVELCSVVLHMVLFSVELCCVILDMVLFPVDPSFYTKNEICKYLLICF